MYNSGNHLYSCSALLCWGSSANVYLTDHLEFLTRAVIFRISRLQLLLPSTIIFLWDKHEICFIKSSPVQCYCNKYTTYKYFAYYKVQQYILPEIEILKIFQTHTSVSPYRVSKQQDLCWVKYSNKLLGRVLTSSITRISDCSLAANYCASAENETFLSSM